MCAQGFEGNEQLNRMLMTLKKQIFVEIFVGFSFFEKLRIYLAEKSHRSVHLSVHPANREPPTANENNRHSHNYLLAKLITGLVLLGLTSCTRPIGNLPVHFGKAETAETLAEGILHIEFLGVGSFLISYRNDAVLTDPFLSNPSFMRVLFGRIKPNKNRVDQYLPDVSKVRMTIAGHSHYDHILDLPYIATKLNDDVLLCGNQTMVHTIAPAQLNQKSVSMNAKAGNATNLGEWIYSANGQVRTMAFLSQHPPHFGNVILYNNPIDKDRKHVPAKTRKWKCGQTLSYLIDFLDESNGKPAYRIFFQSSPAPKPNGFYPPELNEEKTVDVAILSSAMTDGEDSYPMDILEFTQAKDVVLAHWENFFRSRNRKLKQVLKGDLEPVVQQLDSILKPQNRRLILPGPGSSWGS